MIFAGLYQRFHIKDDYLMLLNTVKASGNYIGLILPVIAVLISAYLLGSINFSIILTKVIKDDDIRNYGSGNAGMTNVLRTLGKAPAALTFILDFLKCVAAILIGKAIIAWACTQNGYSHEVAGLGTYIAGFACIIGHMFPIYFGFRGGKGVVTSAAMIVLIDWRCFLILFSIFLIIFAVKRIVSLGSIIGMGLYPLVTFVITFLFDYSGSPLASHGEVSTAYLVAVTILSALTGGVVVWKHKSNIKRLINGTEKPISLKK